jgi:hypothetical protein
MVRKYNETTSKGWTHHVLKIDERAGYKTDEIIEKGMNFEHILIDGDNLDVLKLKGVTENNTANTT